MMLNLEDAISQRIPDLMILADYIQNYKRDTTQATDNLNNGHSIPTITTGAIWRGGDHYRLAIDHSKEENLIVEHYAWQQEQQRSRQQYGKPWVLSLRDPSVKSFLARCEKNNTIITIPQHCAGAAYLPITAQEIKAEHPAYKERHIPQVGAPLLGKFHSTYPSLIRKMGQHRIPVFTHESDVIRGLDEGSIYVMHASLDPGYAFQEPDAPLTPDSPIPDERMVGTIWCGLWGIHVNGVTFRPMPLNGLEKALEPRQTLQSYSWKTTPPSPSEVQAASRRAFDAYAGMLGLNSWVQYRTARPDEMKPRVAQLVQEGLSKRGKDAQWLAQQAKVAPFTIQRLLEQKNLPRVSTMQSILAALEQSS